MSDSLAISEGSKQELVGGTDHEGFRVPSIIPVRTKKSPPANAPAEPAAETKEEEEVREVETNDRTSIEQEMVVSTSSSASSTSSSSSSSTSKAVRVEHKVPALPPLSYNEPRWSSKPPESYFLTVIKNGTVVCEVPISKKPYHVFGRLPSCDIQLEHPSISRYHAVLQYRPQDRGSEESNDNTSSGHVTISSVSVNPTEEGFYVYDLGSTHGTFINKTKIQTRCYYRLRLGQMVKFGGSSRLFLLETGSSSQEEVEEAAEEEIREIVQQKEAMMKRKADLEARRSLAEKESEDMGVMWGMGEWGKAKLKVKRGEVINQHSGRSHLSAI